MRFLAVFKQLLTNLKSRTSNAEVTATADTTCHKELHRQASERMSRIERNYLVLLKRVLEMDGVQLVATPKANNLNSKILQVNNNENQKGLNEDKPTIH